MLAVYLFAMPAKAATVWAIQEGIYQKQKSTAGKVRYVILCDMDRARAHLCIDLHGFQCGFVSCHHSPFNARILLAQYLG